MIYSTAASFIIAMCLGFAAIPVAKRMARKVGLVDHPDQKRKLHETAIPMVGGIVVFLSVLVTVTIVLLLFGRQVVATTDTGPLRLIDILMANSGKLLGLVLASGMILLLGVVDDRFTIRGRQKLLGQILVATILIAFGFRFDTISLFGHILDLKIFSIIVVYGWILVGINSVNLLDGADGFATTIGLLMSIALCLMAYNMGRFDDAIICAAAAGALLAFMCFNFPPASAYLGDAGSMLIGLFIAAMAIKCASKEAATYAFLAPIALLAIPMFDTLAAIVRRRLTGRSIYAVDRGHLHHALIRKGFGPRKALMLFFAMCLMTATGGTMSLIYEKSEYAILSIVAVLVFLMVGRVFGIAEYKLITNRSKSMMRSFLTMPKVDRDSHHASVQLQGERNWDLCWQVLREFAEKNGLQRMTMDLNLPWIHESFHANYSSSDRKSEADEQWSLELPLVVAGRVIGRIDIVADAQESYFGEVISELNDILASLESYFIETIDGKINGPLVDEVQAERQSIEFGSHVDPGILEDVG